jgi:hypothetical protein
MTTSTKNAKDDIKEIEWKPIASRLECLKIEFFYKEFINATGSRDPLVQFDNSLIYDLGQMCKFEDKA